MRGLAQKRETEARVQEIEKEKDKPFARSRDDPDLDAMLKERLRRGDPMTHLVKRKHLESVLPDLGDNEKMKESGFIIWLHNSPGHPKSQLDKKRTGCSTKLLWDQTRQTLGWSGLQ
ncbi:UNVERIFIED_CONTAM: hypothetical protein Sradi_5321800 [Sesamum radiatum]|uniref:Uncharacterized protein n=1 Tax=Sesamum radiatum TaxID=300843 RepID=A0AAW2LQG2_SESRA